MRLAHHQEPVQVLHVDVLQATLFRTVRLWLINDPWQGSTHTWSACPGAWRAREILSSRFLSKHPEKLVVSLRALGPSPGASQNRMREFQLFISRTDTLLAEESLWLGGNVIDKP